MVVEAINATLDTSGLLCPLPVIKTQDRVKPLQAGQVLKVVCTDPGALHDIPTWCRINGHEVVSSSQQDNVIEILVRKGEC